MHERIRIINHEGKQILIADFSECSAREVERLARAIPDYVTTQPLSSVRLLADFRGASFDREALRAMKESAVFDKPYIKKSAWIGSQSFPDDFRKELMSYSMRELPVFTSQEEALAWLVSE